MADIRDTIENTYGNLSRGDKVIANSITNKNTESLDIRDTINE